MAITKAQSRLLHVAVRQLGLSDERYRDILERIAGVRSSKELDGESLDAVLRFFRKLGFRDLPGRDGFGDRPGMASEAQVARIRKLWALYTGDGGTEASLNTWLENTFKVSALRFADFDTAHRAIGALEAMAKRRKPRTAASA